MHTLPESLAEGYTPPVKVIKEKKVKATIEAMVSDAVILDKIQKDVRALRVAVEKLVEGFIK